MNIENLISSTIPVLQQTDTVEHALEVMADNELTEMAVVGEDHYVALVKEDDLLNWENAKSVLNTTGFINFRPAVAAISHPFDALRISFQQHLTIVPVVDNEGRYLGSIKKDTLLNYLAENSGLANTGGIIVLQVPPHDYTLYEIARICENEDVAIISMMSNTLPDGSYEVTLKLNKPELDAVVASLERHKYNVREVYGQQANEENIIDRYKLLMNYINM